MLSIFSSYTCFSELPGDIRVFLLAVYSVGSYCMFLKLCGLWNFTVTENHPVICYKKASGSVDGDG